MRFECGADRRGIATEEHAELSRHERLVRDALGDRVQRSELDRRGEDGPVPIADHTALGRHDQIAAHLVGRAGEQRRAPEGLPVREASRQDQRGDGEQREQQAKTPGSHRLHPSSVARGRASASR